MTVSSKDNPQVKKWRQLSADGHFRRKNGRFACEGARLCSDALLSGVTVETVLYTARAKETYAAQLAPLSAAAESAAEITPALARYMADTASPQGIFCICKMPDRTQTALSPSGRYLALEDVQDPANLGTVIRTAEALGLDGMLLSNGCCDVYNPKVLRGSMGGVFRLPLLTVANFAEVIPTWQENGFHCFACVPAETAVSVCDAPLGDGSICLIGNEGNGLKAETVAACRTAVTVPMAGRAESLNAAMAAGIVMWELKRR